MYGVSRKCQPGVSQGGGGQPHVSADTFSHFSCHIIRHIELIPMKYISEGCIYADYMQPIYWYLVETVTLPWINESPCLLLGQIHGSTLYWLLIFIMESFKMITRLCGNQKQSIFFWYYTIWNYFEILHSTLMFLVVCIEYFPCLAAPPLMGDI